jgi:hypothetical protein
VIRFASVRFDGVLGPRERDDTVRALRSTAADVTSWNDAAGRTYARISFDGARADAALDPLREFARVDVPPLAIWRIEPHDAHRRSRLLHALGGPGRPAGIVDARTDGERALVVEFDCARSAPAFVLALVDVELRGSPGRRIEPLLPLEDTDLAALAGALLREPDLSAERLIETHLEPLLARGAP